MRIWSIHPEYLDTKGLVALWREALLARHVLEGKTKGYKNHPQLDRFKTAGNPSECINQYLSIIYEEAITRGFNFDKRKINWNFEPVKLAVTKGQIEYETVHLLRKLKIRDRNKYTILSGKKRIKTHPLFIVIRGKIEPWENTR